MIRTKHEIFFDESDEQDIIEKYVNLNMSTVSIGKIYNCSHKRIARVLEKYGIQRTGESRRKYNLTANYFHEIDTNIKAYIFGFLCADGSVNPDKQTVSMSLQAGDRDILERIRNEVQSERELEFIDYSQKDDFGYHYQNQYRLLFYCKEMCNDLISNGMLVRKSYCLKMPSCISRELMPHFIRGYFDGNGTVSDRCKSVCIISTFDFCYSLADICKSELGIQLKVVEARNHNGITASISTTSWKDAVTFLEWIYKDADIYLDRKYQKWEKYCKEEKIPF